MTMLTFRTQIDVEELLEELELDDDQAINLIKRIDEQLGSWTVTLALAEHFEKLRAEHAKEEAALAAQNAQRDAYLAQNQAEAFGGGKP